MSKIVYITAQTPFGKGETFILNEMVMLKKLGIDLIIVPRNPPKEVFHKNAKSLVNDTLWIPLIDFKIVANLSVFFFTNPIFIFRIVVDIIFNSRDLKMVLKNLAVLPKALYLAKILKVKDISHIHVHWGSTTSTIAYIISEITGIPWSITLHRWDIKENNLLKVKVKSAKFIRCISNHGMAELIEIVGKDFKYKIKVIHMGVDCDVVVQTPLREKDKFIIVTPANLFPVKGHNYLIDACSILVLTHGMRNFRCYFYGDGPLRKELEKYIEKKHLKDFIKIPGHIAHEKLLKMYAEREIDIVILPSINTDDGEHEGIPVSLMEAMNFGIPVISTNTGGILELIGDGSGIMIEEQDDEAIARFIRKLIIDKYYRNALGEKGKIKVKKDYNLKTNIEGLLRLFTME